MTLNEFVIEAKSLEEFYNKKLNTTQINMWFKELQKYTTEDFKETIDRLCREEQYMPSLSIVLDEIRRVKRNNTKEEDKVPCNICHGTGYYLYRELINGFNYEKACLCVCQNAEGKQYDGTKCSEKEHRQPFYIKTAKEIFGDKLQEEIEKPKQVNKDTKSIISNLTKQMSL